MLTCDLTNLVLAAMLKEHPDITLYLNQDSASLLDKGALEKYT